jgi:hypothetical protein
MSLWLAVLLVAQLVHVHGDVYMHNPRGSNNRLHERSATRTNGDRLFNSQNNNRGGYNVGVRGSDAGTSTVVDLAQKLSLTATDLDNMVRAAHARVCRLVTHGTHRDVGCGYVEAGLCGVFVYTRGSCSIRYARRVWPRHPSSLAPFTL